MAIPKIRRKLRAEERGATAIEYGLICGLIVVAMTAGLALLGGGTAGMWTRINQDMQNN